MKRGSTIQAFIVLCCAMSYSRGADFTENEWEVTNFRSVTKFERLADYYKHLRNVLRNSIADPEERQPIEPKNPKARAHIWKTICDNIFHSQFFVERGERWSDPDVPSIRKKLKEHYSRLYELISAEIVTNAPGSPKIPYEKGYELLPTAYVDQDEGPIEEHIFMCLSEDINDGTIREYYISREYNVNAVIEDTYPIAGRMIFTTNGDNKLTVEALAEETSIEAEWYRRTRFIEPYYIGVRRLARPTTKELDPICKLSDADLLRMCTNFLGASTFERKGLVFKPDLSNVQRPCLKKRIHINTPIFARGISFLTRLILNPSRSFEEWTVGCQAHPASNIGEPVTYYVSRGTDQNTAFAFTYSREIRQLSVYGFFNNVNVVGDLKSTARKSEYNEAEVGDAIAENAVVQDGEMPM